MMSLIEEATSCWRYQKIWTNEKFKSWNAKEIRNIWTQGVYYHADVWQAGKKNANREENIQSNRRVAMEEERTDEGEYDKEARQCSQNVVGCLPLK